MPKIVISLRSDLCVASGEGFASIIDTDVCYDKKGIPYIPSRRLKGVLREAADFIEMDKEKRDKIFGISGNDVEGNLRFSSDALLSDYDTICEELSGASFQQVLDIFTYTRAATRIEECTGAAKEGSLRFNRVVKQYSPINEEPLKFIANCDIDEEYQEDLRDLCGALRSLGYNRNRGLGAVYCALEAGEAEKSTCSEATELELEDNQTYKIPISVTNTTPMVISSMNNNETENYIPGTALLGALAWRYENKQSDEFKELFLQENVIFSNLYVGGKVAPLCYAKLKQEERYVNLADLSKTEKLLVNDILKPLKESYIDPSGNIKEIEKEVIYHYNTKESLLYMQTALSAGQTFVGNITGKGKYLKEVCKLLEGNKIRLGKSKTAQYSNCVIKCGKPQQEEITEQIFTVEEENIAVVLQSDVILINQGINDCRLTTLLSSLQEKMIDEDVKINLDSIDKDRSSLSYRTVGGYSGAWNLKKPHMKTIKAGSVIIFDKVTGRLSAKVFIGVRVNEGFGHCEIMKVSDMPKLKKMSNEGERTNGTSGKGAYQEIIEKRSDKKECRRKALAIAEKKENELPSVISSSQIGRVRLMLEQSKDECDFKKRLTAIKTEAVQKALVEYIEKHQPKEEKEERDFSEYQLFWDTVFRVHRYKRKIEGDK